MRRREFLTLMSGAAAAWPVTARAQQDLLVLGVLVEGTEESGRVSFAQVKDRLAETGYVERQNLFIEYRWANYQRARLAELASDLVQRRVAAIITLGGPPTVAAKAATSSIPIIFLTGFDPVASGYVDSLNRPGGNVTGIYILNPEALHKRFEALHELVPSAKIIAFFYTKTGDETERLYEPGFKKVAEPLGIKIFLLSASRVNELEKIFAEAEAEGAGAILVNAHAVFWGNVNMMIDLAARYKIPVMYPGRGFVTAGGLISYGSDGREANRVLGDFVGRVLKGEKPENLPVQQVTKLELVINAKTAKSLGLEIPLHLYGLAEFIE